MIDNSVCNSRHIKIFSLNVCIVSLLSVVMLSSCTSLGSLKASEKVSDESVLSSNLKVYLKVPVKSNSLLVKDSMEACGLSDKDSSSMVKRLDCLYFACGSQNDSSHIEAVVRGNIPSIAFSKMNRQVYTGDYGSYPYYRDDGMQILQIKKGLYGVSSNSYVFVENYENSINSISKEIELSKADYHWWLNQESDDILFFVSGSNNKIFNYIGIKFPLNYSSAYGRLSLVNESSYVVDVSLTFEDDRVAGALETALKVAALPFKINIKSLDSNTLYITGLLLDEGQIVDLIRTRNFI